MSHDPECQSSARVLPHEFRSRNRRYHKDGAGFAAAKFAPKTQSDGQAISLICRGAFEMAFGSESFLDGVVRTTRRATIRWGGEARDDIFGHEPVLVARCCSPAKLLPGFSKFVGVPRCDDPRRNHPCCWHSQGGPAAMASCRTSEQLRRIGDRNDRTTERPG